MSLYSVFLEAKLDLGSEMKVDLGSETKLDLGSEIKVGLESEAKLDLVSETRLGPGSEMRVVLLVFSASELSSEQEALELKPYCSSVVFSFSHWYEEFRINPFILQCSNGEYNITSFERRVRISCFSRLSGRINFLASSNVFLPILPISLVVDLSKESNEIFLLPE